MAQVRHIAMFVKDADATAAFYEKALGLRKTAERISTVVIKARVVDMTDGSLVVTLICPDDPGEHRDLLPAQAGNPSARAAGRQARLGR